MTKPLKPEEFADVLLVTKGESYNHRRWPEEVVRAFASAQVITAKVPHCRAADRERPAAAGLTRFLRLG